MTVSTGQMQRNKNLFQQGLKECCDCHATKALTEFSEIPRNVGRGISHYTAACKPCRAERNRVARLNPENRAKVRAAYVAKTYGLSKEDYNALFESQKGCCAICLRHASEMKKGLVVDHDHETNEVRGLLCGECNSGIGMLSDDAATVLAAHAYLTRKAD